VRFSNISSGSKINNKDSKTSSTIKRVDNERKAQKVLIIMFIIFVIAWLPFFLINSISGICDECNEYFSPTLLIVITWLGYMASLANPVIYTMFNKKFRLAFLRLILCQTGSKMSLGSFRSSYVTQN
jgi:hypothetical protein